MNDENKSERRTRGKIVLGDNLEFLRSVPSESVDLIYIDPPFNTGHIQTKRRIQVTQDDEHPDRVGFKGRGYRTRLLDQKEFNDSFEDFKEFLFPRLEESHRVLKAEGSFFLHIDYREVHYCKLYLDQIYGRDSFINEIIWAYDYGARSRKRWSPKHDNILWYAKSPKNYTFNYEVMDRIPYMAPGLVGAEKAARGKTPTDTWWHTIVSPTGKEKTGYPTQKPIGIIERIIRIHSNPGDLVLDFFAGSGTTGEAAGNLGRDFVLVDSLAEATDVMQNRLARFNTKFVVFDNQILDTASSGGEKLVDQTSAGSSGSIPDQRNIHIIVATVWDYEDPLLNGLEGPQKDADLILDVLSNNSHIGLFPSEQIEIYQNPTVEQLRNAFVKYAYDRSAKGDILIFYFSGHGAAVGNDFWFCLADTRLRPDGGGLLPLSALAFDDILSTVQKADVHPIFIIDACFSGKAAPNDQMNVLNTMHDNMSRAAASSYALFCACYEEAYAVDTSNGGAFTSALHEVASAGLSDEKHKKLAFLDISDLSAPVQEKLTLLGWPLSKLYVAPDLPQFDLIRNVSYKPRTEKLHWYHKDTLDLMWNEGTPRSVSLKNIRDDCGQSAYGNHSKLSLKPWRLVEDDGNSNHRRLTARGNKFMRNKLAVPMEIIVDPITEDWGAAPGTFAGSPSDIPKRNQRKQRSSK